jgi:hypothetical protein
MAGILAARPHISVVHDFHRVTEVALRFVATLATVIHLAPALSDEVDGKTWTYLWSRPFPRPALLYGKVLAIAPAVMVLATISLGVAYLITFETDPGTHLPALARSLGGAYAATLGAAAFAVAIGSLFPRHPLVFGLAWFAADQILFLVPNVAKLSSLYHARFLAGLPASKAEPESVAAAALWLVGLTIAMLAVGGWRVRRSEYARADA